MAWNVNDATGLVSLNTSYQLSVPPFTETPTNDACVKVYAVGQRASVGQHARFYYNGPPNMDPKAVREIQQALADRGHNPGPIDGFYGEKTVRAVVSFQLAHGFVADGEVGRRLLKHSALSFKGRPSKPERFYKYDLRQRARFWERRTSSARHC
jgi:Putative peptidoglycan binding domain